MIRTTALAIEQHDPDPLCAMQWRIEYGHRHQYRKEK
jgi:hypothetical protein